MDPIQSIVVPMDFSPHSRAALRRAAWLAAFDGAAVHLVHAFRLPIVAAPYGVTVPAEMWEGIRIGTQENLDAIAKEVRDAGLASVTAMVAESLDPVGAIEEAVATHEADLVVMGTRGHTGLKHTFLGSVAERTIRTLHCPVLAVKDDPDQEASPIRRILVPVDFSDHSDEAARLGSGLAARLGASLDLLHAVDFAPEYAALRPAEAIEIESEMRKIGAERLDEVARNLTDTDVSVELHLMGASPAKAIVAEAERRGSDLIVMGTRGQSGLPHLILGSVAERTLREAPCSVLTVKAPEARGS